MRKRKRKELTGALLLAVLLLLGAQSVLAAPSAGRSSQVIKLDSDKKEGSREPGAGKSGNGISGNSASGNGISRNSASGNSSSGNSASGNGISRNSASGNSIFGNSVSGNGIFGNSASGNNSFGNSVSGNSSSGNSVSENDISGNSASENSIFRNGVSGSSGPGGSISGNQVSGNSVSENTAKKGPVVFPENPNARPDLPADFYAKETGMTLAERQQNNTSYQETINVNEADRQVISSNTIDFSDLTIACLGDSLTEATNLDNMEDYRQYSYPSVLKEILGAKAVYNLGIGGSSVGRYWFEPFVERYREIPGDVDLILVFGGINDEFAADLLTFGGLSERKTRTFCGDLDELMINLKTEYLESKIIFITPLPTIMQDHLRAERPQLLEQQAYNNVYITLAKEHNIQLVDLYNSNILDSHDPQVVEKLMPDGVHCNPEGYRILAEHLAARIIKSFQADAAYVGIADLNGVSALGIKEALRVANGGTVKKPQLRGREDGDGLAENETVSENSTVSGNDTVSGNSIMSADETVSGNGAQPADETVSGNGAQPADGNTAQ